MSAIASLDRTTRIVDITVAEHLKASDEIRQLKDEIDAISNAIQQTRQELATLHHAGAPGREVARVADELSAVVLGTEQATHTILSTAELVDDLAGNLSARGSSSNAELGRQISEHIVTIFEACNFQDITGQRIAKVVNAMRFIEERVGEMIRIWGGLDSLTDMAPREDPARQGERALLNGPALPTDEATSQSDIDALFS